VINGYLGICQLTRHTSQRTWIFSITAVRTPKLAEYSVSKPVSALANAEPDCDPCGWPLKVNVHSQKRIKLFGI